MSTSTYKCICLDCGNEFDVRATIQEKEGSDSDNFICPKCKSKNIRQRFSAGNFIKNIFKSKNKGGCCSSSRICDVSPDPNTQKDGNSPKSNRCG